MLKRTLSLIALCVCLAACADIPTQTAVPLPTAIPIALATPTPLPSPEQSARDFLGAWEKGQYEVMYALLSEPSKASITQEAFVKRYRDIATEGAFTSIKTQIKDMDIALSRAQINFSVSIDSALAGPFTRQNQMVMSYERAGWRVEWKPTVIFSELGPGNVVSMFVHGNSRGDILDRTGQIKLATNEPMVVVGIVPKEIDDESALLGTLAPILEMDAKAIKDKYAQARPEWLVPLKTITAERAHQFDAKLKALAAVSLRDSERRIYPQGTTAEHAVGYVGAINADELLTLAPQGYSADNVLGRAALEKWGEKYLRGDLGGTLVVLQPDGQIVATLGARGPTPGRNIYTTLDAGLQKFVEQELGTKTGAAIVLDVRTDEILALASNPGFDLNTLVQGTSQQVQQLLNDSKHPLINRATQGLYPTGSVFKIVTISAGLEKGGFTPDSQFQCNGIWTGLGGQYAKRDWLSGGHGRLNLFSGLVQSCDIVFYDVGLALDKKDRSILPTYARAFGFGAPTNGAGLTDEAAGNVPDPAKGNVFVGDMVNVAIGQGDFLATPFQVANMLAAVGNGGTLNRPRLVAKVSGPNDERRQDFLTEAIARLPVSAGNLKVIQAALKAVTSTGPGTAAFAFAGSKIQVAGKTGTAESPPGEPHAWFAAYAPADDPKIAVVVMIEHSGEGSIVAAPIVRKILEKYLNQK